MSVPRGVSQPGSGMLFLLGHALLGIAGPGPLILEGVEGAVGPELLDHGVELRLEGRALREDEAVLVVGDLLVDGADAVVVAHGEQRDGLVHAERVDLARLQGCDHVSDGVEVGVVARAADGRVDEPVGYRPVEDADLVAVELLGGVELEAAARGGAVGLRYDGDVGGHDLPAEVDHLGALGRVRERAAEVDLVRLDRGEDRVHGDRRDVEAIAEVLRDVEGEVDVVAEGLAARAHVRVGLEHARRGEAERAVGGVPVLGRDRLGRLVGADPLCLELVDGAVRLVPLDDVVELSSRQYESCTAASALSVSTAFTQSAIEA